MYENPDRRDSARREDPVAKELRFDRGTRRETQKCSEKPSEGQNRGKRRTHGRDTQQAEKTTGRSPSEREGTQQEIKCQENPAQDRGVMRRRATKRRGDP